MAGYSWTKENILELIRLVKVNPVLYAKKEKGYKDQQRKNQTWESLGLCVHPPCSGIEASKRFKNLRDTFCRERKKLVTSEPRSGAGADEAYYVTDWEWYVELQFLSEHISGRTTTSNMSRKQVSTPLLEQPVTVEMPGSALLKADALSPVALRKPGESTQSPSVALGDSSQSPSAGTADGDWASGSTENEDSSQSSFSDTSILSTPQSSTPICIRGKAAKRLLSSRAPPADLPKKARKVDDLSLNLAKLTASAEAVAQSIAASSSPASSDGDVAGMIKFALSNVEKKHKLSCMIDMLKVAQIYQNGQIPKITPDL
ncbi:unnamed protein product [Brassicogethes aeneus]|uniref:MADF domain-containing protein n=1 Tax=Brassicogethes aeneus TaxID=1431903 RepID=A0A9P0BEX1_BRAAE|nr:unnamed protein product [Brassicogethes aeneus]